jgi:hypothetical protein
MAAHQVAANAFQKRFRLSLMELEPLNFWGGMILSLSPPPKTMQYAPLAQTRHERSGSRRAVGSFDVEGGFRRD